jgi:hypothetical protein
MKGEPEIDAQGLPPHRAQLSGHRAGILPAIRQAVSGQARRQSLMSDDAAHTAIHVAIIVDRSAKGLQAADDMSAAYRCRPRQSECGSPH